MLLFNGRWKQPLKQNVLTLIYNMKKISKIIIKSFFLEVTFYALCIYCLYFDFYALKKVREI